MTCEEVLKSTNYGNSTDKVQVNFQKVFQINTEKVLYKKDMTQYGFEYALKEDTPFIFTGYEDLLNIRSR